MAKKNIVIVESPAKSKTITKYLGKDFEVLASYGHVRDLPVYTIGIDLENQFEPTYKTIKGKEKVLKAIKDAIKGAETIYLATDPDREGEAIAWHVKEGAKIPDEKTKRVVFNEITKTAVQNAIANPRDLDMNLIDAQQARRILDRIIGYRMSPLLSKKIRKGLSAGRVQSVAVKLLCERERLILAFVPEEYWVIDGQFLGGKPESEFKAKLFAKGTAKNKVELKNKAEADTVLAELKGASVCVDSKTAKEQLRNPYPPFMTSTLQQDASRKLGWTASRTMRMAQQLYEGVTVNGETQGLITYMRTDSLRVADEALVAAKKLVGKRYGSEYLPPSPRQYKKGKNAQDAHEAIRPTVVELVPVEIQSQLSEDQFKLYRLIWDRFVASQMASAKVEGTTLILRANDYLFKLTGQVILFDGFLKVYQEGRDEDDEEETNSILPNLEEGDAVKAKAINGEQKFTQPPKRFTEASLVKELEERGIGRPSTYAPTIGTIVDRQYVERNARQLRPTDLGMLVDEKLGEFFDRILDYDFTAKMETQLDEISEGKYVWHELVGQFFELFQKDVDNAMENMEKVNMDRPIDEKCEKCESDMVIKTGRYGEFKACTNYPECKNTKAIIVEMGVTCPDCGSAIVEKRSKRGKVFYGCSGFPNCKKAFWDKPIQEKCPKCSYGLLIVKEKAGKIVKTYCPQEECDYEKSD
ncbi:MAG: type I DNA topoisomerase [bacterium]|nr:type I DNA topoisomerase [bacterium]